MSKKIMKKFVLLLLSFCLIFTSVQVTFAQDTETERIIYSQSFLEKVKEYIDNVCWGEWIPEQEEYKNISLSGVEVIHYKGLKIYSEDKEMVVFGLSDFWCTVSTEIIDGYVFENPSFYGNKNNKTGLCVYKDETVYSIAQAVEQGVVSAEELAEIIPYTKKDETTEPPVTEPFTPSSPIKEPINHIIPVPQIKEPANHTNETKVKDEKSSASDEEDVLINYMAEKSGQDNKEDFFVKRIGVFGGYTLFYGKTSDGKKINKKITYGNYAVGFQVKKEISPYILGLYFVKGTDVYTLDEVYKKKLLNGRQFYLAGNTVKTMIENGDKDFNFTMLIYAYCDVGFPKITKIKAGQKIKFRCCDYGYKYKTSDEKVAIVKNGNVIALKKGTVKITSYQVFGEKMTRKFKVTTDPEIVKNGKTIKNVMVKKGDIIKVKIQGKADDVKNKYTNTKKAKVISSDNAKVIKIKGLKKGITTLKIRVNRAKTLKLKVNVV